MKRSAERRRARATKRQAEYDQLTLAQKIARAKAAPGESKRQLAKLTAMKKLQKLQAKRRRTDA